MIDIIQMPFEAVIIDITSKYQKIKTSDYKVKGQFPIIDQSQKFIAGYTDDEKKVVKDHLPVIIFGDHTKILKYIDFPIAIGADGVKVLKVKKHAYSKYIYYYLKSLKLTDAGYSRHFKYLKEKILPIPSNILDQIRIATLLSRIETLIEKRRESLRLLDELAKGVFLEMFGINKLSEIEWPILSLNEVSEVVSGITKGKKYKDKKTQLVPYLRVANVQDGYIDIRDLKLIEATPDEIKTYNLKKGDILLTEGGDPDKLGRGAVYYHEIENCIFQNHLFRVRVRFDLIHPEYLSALVSSAYGKRYFYKASKQTTGIASINSTQLKKFPIILPPLDIQNEFVEATYRINSLKEKYQISLAELENLYASTSQIVFRGELDLSEIDIEETAYEDSIEDTPADKVEGSFSSKDKEELIISNILKIADSIQLIINATTNQMKTISKLLPELLPLMTKPINTLDKDTLAALQQGLQSWYNRLKEGVTFEDFMKQEGEDFEFAKQELFLLLKGENPFLKQTFDIKTKQIIFRLNEAD